MGLGIVRASIISAVAEDTGDDSVDAQVKIRRLINRRGRSFCELGNFPFLRHNLSFDITNAGGYTYSGASYLPDSYRRVVAAYLLDSNSNRYDLTEVGISDAYKWPNPDNTIYKRPTEFCITRPESGYWEIQFNYTPDDSYTVYLEIELQWTDIAETAGSDTTEVAIHKRYYDYFVHYITMLRLKQQGDAHSYAAYRDEWIGTREKQGMLSKMLGTLGATLKTTRLVAKPLLSDDNNLIRTNEDYNERGANAW